VRVENGAVVDAGPALPRTYAPDVSVADDVLGGTSILIPRLDEDGHTVLFDSGGRLGSGDTPVDLPGCVDDPFPVCEGDPSDPPPGG